MRDSCSVYRPLHTLHYFRCTCANLLAGAAIRPWVGASGGVVGVDGDVIAGEVAGPETAGAAAEAEIDVDGELGLVKVAVCGPFVEVRGASTVFADEEIAETNGDACGIDFGAGVADGSDQPAPIGVAASPGSLNQGRLRDGCGDEQGVGVRGAPANM